MNLVLAAITAALFGPTTTPKVGVCSDAEMMRGAFTHGLSPSFAKSPFERLLEGLDDTDVQSVSLDLEPNFTTHAIAGTATTVVESKVDGLSRFSFRLGNNFAVSSATLDGRPMTVVFDDASHAHIDFDQAYNNGQTFTIAIAYSGVVQSQGFGSIAFGTHSGNPFCFTLSEPWYSYSWWPNKDDNADKSVDSIAVTVPNTMQVAANGLLQGVDTLSGNRLKYRWSSAYPMSPYLLCFGATNFNHFSDTFSYSGGTMPLEFYIWPENDNTGNRNGWLAVKQMLATYGTWYGTYPFINEKYGIYQFSFSGGQEHQTMTGEVNFGDNLSAHELSHQWWGDNITCGTWSDIWLNEGFATYSEAVWLEKQPGSSGLPALKAAMQSRTPGSVNGTVYITNPTDINRIFSNDFTYLKGGWVQHMLRHVVGDTNFWNGLALYRSRYQLKTAITDNYQAAMQDQSGMNLTQFFQEWVYQPGAPKYQYGWTNLAVNGQNYLAMHIKQVQSASYPTFAMPIDTRFTAGSTSTVSVSNSATVQNYLFPTSAPATALAIDPDGWILNTGISNVAYAPGPPKVVSSDPLPGAVYQLQPIKVVFHTPVHITQNDVLLLGPSPVPPKCALSYDSATNTATIVPSRPLRAGQWELRIYDTVTAVNSGKTLDGELSGTGLSAYPSGDGIPGGVFHLVFTVN